MHDPHTQKQRFTLVRSLTGADFITLANAGAGTGAILACLAYLDQGDTVMLWTAFGLLPLAALCDVLDGIVARKRRASPYGPDLDSLADIVSFGVAPAVLAYTLGMRGGWDAVVLVYFVMCGIGRLARFNVTAEEMTTASGKVSHFQGTPIPTSLVLVLVLALATFRGAVGDGLWLGGWQLGPFQLHPLVFMYAISGSAMVASRLEIPKP